MEKNMVHAFGLGHFINACVVLGAGLGDLRFENLSSKWCFHEAYNPKTLNPKLRIIQCAHVEKCVFL